MKHRPNVLTIAGFDPSSGAGLTSDIKTMEQLKCYGLAVCTANTIQSDTIFKQCYWTAVHTIVEQLEMLYTRFEIDTVKIGIIENWQVLQTVIELLLQKNPKTKIILDPVLRSTTNFTFNADVKQQSDTILDAILEQIYLITPNVLEIEKLYPNKTTLETIAHIQSKTNLFLKGGHHETQIGKDHLYTVNGKEYTLNSKGKGYTEKHGSGCILSSAIASYLALDFPILKACYRAKRYTERVLISNKELLGYHR